MQVKTYVGKHPAGLQRALFFASEQDFALYLDPITDQILRLFPDVAFYYSQDPADITDEVLDSVCLAVCPVTLSFLREDCRQRREIFPRVQNKHIALLPILEEADIMAVFDEVCGSIQFLDAVSQDDTALSFEHKLIAFLDDVLLEEKLSDKIRQAFDAYIFLSYRKKDRQFANRIMRLIHENDFMRDVAIWYDEYLVPGEDYNEAIENAIIKAGLVTLVVTPNLVNEDNYIRRTEYPAFLDQKKAVLPILAQETDREALKNEFEALPDPIAAERHEEIARVLLERFGAEGVGENNDPDHLFFIGLAYLYGMEVEADSERAVQLLTRASDGGCLEASRKLVSLYLEGRYVEADYNLAGEILHRMIRQMEESRERLDRDGFMEMIGYDQQLARIFVDCGRPMDALMILRQALSCLEEAAERYPDEWMEARRGKILEQYAGTLRSIPVAEEEEDARKAMIAEIYEEVCAIYYDYFDSRGYDPEWDILPLLRPMTEVSGEDQFVLGLRDEDGLGRMYFESLKGKEFEDGSDRPNRVFLMLQYSFAKLICDYCEMMIPRFMEMRFFTAMQRVEELKAYEKTIKAAFALLCRGGRTEEAIEVGERYYRAFGRFYHEMERYEEAKTYYEMAFTLLADRDESPDCLLAQVENARNLIRLAEDLGVDGEADIRYAYFTLSECLDKLARATGVEIYRKQFEENEAEILKRGFDDQIK